MDRMTHAGDDAVGHHPLAGDAVMKRSGAID